MKGCPSTGSLLNQPCSLGIYSHVLGKSANAGDARDANLIPGSGRSLEGGHGNPLQYSCRENPMNRGAWGGYSPWDCKESDTTEHAGMLGNIGLLIGWRETTVICWATMEDPWERPPATPFCTHADGGDASCSRRHHAHEGAHCSDTPALFLPRGKVKLRVQACWGTNAPSALPLQHCWEDSSIPKLSVRKSPCRQEKPSHRTQALPAMKMVYLAPIHFIHILVQNFCRRKSTYWASFSLKKCVIPSL